MGMVSRRMVRERVLQGLYAYELGGGDEAHVLDTVVKPYLDWDDGSWSFASRLFRETVAMSEEADTLIRRHADNWDLSRMAQVDRLLLRMAFCEFLRFSDIPPKVTINEAIDIGKRFSTDNSGRFINGILDAGLLRLTAEDRLRKAGRGLIGTSRS